MAVLCLVALICTLKVELNDVGKHTQDRPVVRTVISRAMQHVWDRGLHPDYLPYRIASTLGQRAPDRQEVAVRMQVVVST